MPKTFFKSEKDGNAPNQGDKSSQALTDLATLAARLGVPLAHLFNDNNTVVALVKMMDQLPAEQQDALLRELATRTEGKLPFVPHP